MKIQNSKEINKMKSPTMNYLLVCHNDTSLFAPAHGGTVLFTVALRVLCFRFVIKHAVDYTPEV